MHLNNVYVTAAAAAVGLSVTEGLGTSLSGLVNALNAQIWYEASTCIYSYWCLSWSLTTYLHASIVQEAHHDVNAKKNL